MSTRLETLVDRRQTSQHDTTLSLLPPPSHPPFLATTRTCPPLSLQQVKYATMHMEVIQKIACSPIGAPKAIAAKKSKERRKKQISDKRGVSGASGEQARSQAVTAIHAKAHGSHPNRVPHPAISFTFFFSPSDPRHLRVQTVSLAAFFSFGQTSYSAGQSSTAKGAKERRGKKTEEDITKKKQDEDHHSKKRNVQLSRQTRRRIPGRLNLAF